MTPETQSAVERVETALEIATKYTGGIEFGERPEGHLSFADLRTILTALSEASAREGVLEGALSAHDKLAGECRIDGVRPQRDTTKDCDRCGSGMGESCGAKASAAYAFIQSARTALSRTQNEDQSK